VERNSVEHGPGRLSAATALQPLSDISVDARGFSAFARLRDNLGSGLNVAGAVVSPERSIATPVQDQHWSASVATEIKWCVQNNIQSVTLRLTPENLGPLEMRVEMRDSQVNVSFTAAHVDTRSAIESSLPRLREMLASDGLSLNQANVNQEARRESRFTPLHQRSGGEVEHSEAPTATRRAVHLVDEYA
jgi:flagellar hook-length control protein FliK